MTKHFPSVYVAPWRSQILTISHGASYLSTHFSASFSLSLHQNSVRGHLSHLLRRHQLHRRKSVRIQPPQPPNQTHCVQLELFIYSTATIGSTPDAQVFGLAQCRPDASAATCIDCLNSTAAAVAEPKGGCPLRKSGAYRADHCVLRYSDQRFFSILETALWVFITEPNNASNSVVFNQTVNDLMSKISPKASEADSRFGVGVANYSDSRDIYGMAWCTQDLSSSDCQQCLEQVAAKLPVNKVGGQVMTVSCITRFETTSFFSLSPPPPLKQSPTPPLQQSPTPPLQQSPTPPSRADVADAGSGNGKGNNTVKMVLTIALPVAFALALLSFSTYFAFWRKKPSKRLPTGNPVLTKMRSTESLLFDLDTIIKATNDFSEENKLGEGGFGPVYKGLLEDGQQIAVKRLSRTSTQGLVEWKTEAVLVAKLQHRNLVRLFGFCLEQNEKMLVYEYLPKRSLDKYLFDHAERARLDWGTRYKIIEGIGRGLLYLHEDSRLKIIHRDLKASNILLDDTMTPKISDFGLARLFLIDQSEQNTNRIAGTYGYMAPEYALHGILSTKSDVFSYGVLILEIITRRRNGVFTHLGHDLDLLSYVWKFWNQGTAMQVVDQCLGHEYRPQEVQRCLHIGLLCVQDDSLLRPSMASVMLMISSYSTTIPSPMMPSIYVGGSIFENEQLRSVSSNSVTITNVNSR